MQSYQYTSSISPTGLSDYRCLQPDDALEEIPHQAVVASMHTDADPLLQNFLSDVAEPGNAS